MQKWKRIKQSCVEQSSLQFPMQHARMEGSTNACKTKESLGVAGVVAAASGTDSNTETHLNAAMGAAAGRQKGQLTLVLTLGCHCSKSVV